MQASGLKYWGSLFTIEGMPAGKELPKRAYAVAG
jgi:hypothetical protein